MDRRVPKVPPVRGAEDSDVNLADVEDDDDAETTIAPLRWPEPPRTLSDRPRAAGSVSVGLSQTVGPPSYPRGSSLRSILVALVMLAAGFGLVLRARRMSFDPAAARRPSPSVASAIAPPPAAPFTAIVPSAPRVANKPAIDISSLPKAPTIPAPPRPQPARNIKPAVRAPASSPQRTEEDSDDVVPRLRSVPTDSARGPGK